MTAVDGNTVIGVHARNITLRFTVSNALPEVTADNIQWFFMSANGSLMEVRQDFNKLWQITELKYYHW